MIEQLNNRKLLSSYHVIIQEVGSSQESVVVADWNHDGKIGIAFSNYSNQNIKVGYKAYGGIANTFVRYHYTTIPMGVGIDQVATADLNGDSLPDLVVSSYDKGSFGVLINRKGYFTFNGWYDVANINSVSLGDFDRNGKIDLACGKSYKNGLTTFFGVGDGTFSGPYNLDTPYKLNSVAVGDVIGGNGRDVVGVDFNSDKAIIFRYDGGTSFVQDTVLDTGDSPADVIIGDVTGDSNLDIISANYFGDSISIFSNGISSSFSTGPKSNPTGLAVADYDGDGDKDLAVVCAGNDTLVKFNHSTSLILESSISLAQPVNVSWDPSAVDAPVPRRIINGFYDNDGKEDLFICNEGVNYVSVSCFNNIVRLGPFVGEEIRFRLLPIL